MISRAVKTFVLLSVFSQFLGGCSYGGSAIITPVSERVTIRDMRYCEIFGTVEMRHGATVLRTASAPSTPYSSRSVERDTEFHFYNGTPVFELIDPEGKIYIMQSYSVQHITDQSFADLASLDERISLPSGWQFRTRTLVEDLVVEDINGIATVTQDDFRNTYQLTTLTLD